MEAAGTCQALKLPTVLPERYAVPSSGVPAPGRLVPMAMPPMMSTIAARRARLIGSPSAKAEQANPIGGTARRPSEVAAAGRLRLTRGDRPVGQSYPEGAAIEQQKQETEGRQ